MYKGFKNKKHWFSYVFAFLMLAFVSFGIAGCDCCRYNIDDDDIAQQILDEALG